MDKYKEYGLTNYQVLCWVQAIVNYGPGIMKKSLLSQEQKDLLISLSDQEWAYLMSY